VLTNAVNSAGYVLWNNGFYGESRGMNVYGRRRGRDFEMMIRNFSGVTEKNYENNLG
jgi:hypothetical protein